MEDGNVFFYAALIVIAFISWVVGKIREAIDAFRERQERREYRDRPIRTDIGPPTSAAPASPPPPQISQRDRAREAMRETYRALGIPFPEDEETSPPPPTSTPPRQPRPAARQQPRKVAPAGDQLTADERKALKRLQQRGKTKASAPAAGSTFGFDAESAHITDAGRLRRLLGNRSATRQAILLKEILDPPKSLQ